MAALSIQLPFPVFTGSDGQPIEGGYVWIGQANLDPRLNPVNVYFDKDLTIPAGQPLRTVGGYITHNGSPAQLFIDGTDYSILVQNRKGVDIYSFPSGTGIAPDASSITYVPASGPATTVQAKLREYESKLQEYESSSGSALIGYLPGGTGAVTRTVQDKLREVVSVNDFGATGDGTTDDSAAIQACITAAQAAGKAVYFPDGTYVISSLGNQAGRLIMHGSGNATLKGTFTYQQSSFPTSADTLTPLTPTAPYFHASGLNFESTTTGYALQLFTNEQPNFISTFSLTGCRFYGNKGLLARHMIGFELTHCEFNNKVAGARFESCTNGVLVSCRWQNQAESGVWITRASDQTLRSPGGENIKFVLCEWAVCSFGIVAEQHMWLTMESCLLDYCTMPLYLSGSHYAKASQTYFGASNTPVSRFNEVPGYLSPGITGVAVYGRPGGTPLGSRVVGFTAHNCEFINYSAGSNQPLVYIDGYVDATYNMSGEEVSFYDCLFYATASHSASNLLEISHTKIVRVIGNRFVSVDKSTSMTNAYRMNQCMSPLGHSNDFYHCRQGGAVVGSAWEKMLASVYVQSQDPGAIGAGNIWVQP